MAKNERTKTTAVTLKHISAEAFKAMIGDNVAATPENYNIYFEKKLDEKPDNIKQEIKNILEIERNNVEEADMMRARVFKEGFASTKKTISYAGNIHKTLSRFNLDLQKQLPKIKYAADKQQVRNQGSLLRDKMFRVHGCIRKNADEMKRHYTQTVEIINRGQQKLHEGLYGVYQKHYLFSMLEKETALAKRFRHSTSLLAVRIKDEIIDPIDDPSIKNHLIRAVARMLLKTSRRSDVVAHHEGATFMLFLRHTDLENAKKNAKRLKAMALESHFFFDELEISLDIEIGIALVKSGRSAEESICLALEALDLAREYDLPAAAVSTADTPV